MKQVWMFVTKAWWLVIKNALTRYPRIGIVLLTLAVATPLSHWQYVSQQNTYPASIPSVQDLSIVDGKARYVPEYVRSSRTRAGADGMVIEGDGPTRWGITTGLLPDELRANPALWHGKRARFWVDPTTQSVWQVAIEDRTVIPFEHRVRFVERHIFILNANLLLSVLCGGAYISLVIVSYRQSIRESAESGKTDTPATNR